MEIQVPSKSYDFLSMLQEAPFHSQAPERRCGTISENLAGFSALPASSKPISPSLHGHEHGTVQEELLLEVLTAATW